jgi:hypothetical protein|tara:strand:- start:265 stop:642 length:378 start_codon:yes stop_codon:yes gene_type:complete
MTKKIDISALPRGAQDSLENIVKIYNELNFVGRPRLRGMQVEKAVSGTKDLQTNHDPTFQKYQIIQKNMTRYLNKTIERIYDQINDQKTRTPRKRCKDPKHPKGVRKNFGIDYDFCPYCKGKLYG